MLLPSVHYIPARSFLPIGGRFVPSLPSAVVGIPLASSQQPPEWPLILPSRTGTNLTPPPTRRRRGRILFLSPLLSLLHALHASERGREPNQGSPTTSIFLLLTLSYSLVLRDVTTACCSYRDGDHDFSKGREGKETCTDSLLVVQRRSLSLFGTNGETDRSRGAHAPRWFCPGR